ELDFYIKNEVLFIDDINTEEPAYFTAQLSKIKALKAVATKIITFLAQIEDFQKKLWLKKKFVVSTNYCITLDRIPEKYYVEISANQAQLEEWKTLYGVTLNSVDEMSVEKCLVLDTKHFSEEFKDRLLAEFDNLDEQTNGTLINSENFQALSLLQTKYRKRADTIYIDPPYNSPSSEISYKNNFKHSSFSSLMENRLEIGKQLLNEEEGVQIIAIDENEQNNLFSINAQIYDSELYDNTLIS